MRNITRCQPQLNWLAFSGFVSVTILLASLITGCGSKEAAKPVTQAILVKSQVIGSGKVRDTSEFVGTLEAAQAVEVKPQIQGRVEKVYAQPGDRVQQGTVLMTLTPDQTVAQLAGAQASVQDAKAARYTAVKQREVAKAELATAQSDVQLAQTNYGRASFLLGQGAIGKFTYDQAKNTLDTQKNRYKAAQDQLKAAEAAIYQADAVIQKANAQVDAAQVDVRFKQVQAPITGIVGDMPVKEGSYVTTGQTLTSVTQNDQLDLRIAIPSNLLPKLRMGLPVELSDSSSNKVFGTGQINFISPNVNPQAQSVLVKARFPNQTGRLQNGQFVRADVIWGQSPGILVPTTAVSRSGNQGFVFVIAEKNAEGKPQTLAEQRPVALGAIQGNQYQVRDGLKAGERIAVSNILKLRNGVLVQPQS